MKAISTILTDIDDTLTDHGQLGPEAWSALWELKRAGKKIIPVTGRPAGWCELIARQWPVDGVIGENGAFYFRYFNRNMKRVFIMPEIDRRNHRTKLDTVIAPEILQKVPGSAIASDQFCRLSDLAIDFCEDVSPLPQESVQKIVEIFRIHGAQAKISSIHVNGWFGSFNKLSTTKKFLKDEFKYTEEQIQNECIFIGDSPNDEPMWEFFKNSAAVGNIRNFESQLTHKPHQIMKADGGKGFAEFASKLLP